MSCAVVAIAMTFTDSQQLLLTHFNIASNVLSLLGSGFIVFSLWSFSFRVVGSSDWGDVEEQARRPLAAPPWFTWIRRHALCHGAEPPASHARAADALDPAHANGARAVGPRAEL